MPFTYRSFSIITPPPRFSLPHLERPSVPQMLLYADSILGILALLFARPFSFWICRMHGSWRRRRVVFLILWVVFSGFVVLDSFMSGYGVLASYCGFSVTLQLFFFATSLLGALFPSIMLRAFRIFGFCIHGTLWVAAIVPVMNGTSLSVLSEHYPQIAASLPRPLSSARLHASHLLQLLCAFVFSVWIYLDRVTFAAVLRDDYVKLSGYEKLALHLANVMSFLPAFLIWVYLFAPPTISLRFPVPLLIHIVALSNANACSDFGAHPPWNAIILVGATFNFLLLWMLTYVSSLWVGFPMWMWSGRALIIQVAAQLRRLHFCRLPHNSQASRRYIRPRI